MNGHTLCIGTSGWVYAGWIGNFYPLKIKPQELLPYYTQSFNSVELNNSFYQTPKENNIKKWLELIPQDFVFSCKANRYITHMKKLQDVTESTERLLTAFSHFGDKLGPILFQFPPYWPIDIATLKAFVEQLPEHKLYTFEFRHKSWFGNELYELLNKHQMALCLYDHKTYQSPEIITGPFVYMRMHGPLEEAYLGSYEEKTLTRYAHKITEWQKQGKAVYCYFDNDAKGQAPIDAKRLRALISDTSTHITP